MTRRVARTIALAMVLVVGSGCSLVKDGEHTRVADVDPTSTEDVDPTTTEDVDPDRVLVVGDSVTHLSQDEIQQELDWATTVDIRAHDGYRTDQLLATTQDGIAQDPDVAIIMTGYNDILGDTVETDALDTMVELVDQVPCTVWLLLPEENAYDTEIARRWNARVQELTAGHPTIHLTREWLELIEDAPAFTYVSKADGVHPNELGQQAIAEVMADAVDRECR